jgi:hypothetical protein
MTTEHQREQEERRRITLEEAQRREQEQATSFHKLAQADADAIPRDRFHAVTVATVVGSKSNVASAYPAASSAHQTELPDEPPLGFSVDDLESSVAPPAEATGAPAGATASSDLPPSQDEASDAGASLSHKDEDHA